VDGTRAFTGAQSMGGFKLTNLAAASANGDAIRYQQGFKFETISCPAGTNPVADALSDTLTLLAGANIAITGDSAADSVTIAVMGLPTVAFKTIDCPAGTDPVADAADDTLTLAAGGTVTITGDSGTDTITISETHSGTDHNFFKTIACPAGTNPVADSQGDTLTFANGTGISISGDSGTDTITITGVPTGTGVCVRVAARIGASAAIPVASGGGVYTAVPGVQWIFDGAMTPVSSWTTNKLLINGSSTTATITYRIQDITNALTLASVTISVGAAAFYQSTAFSNVPAGQATMQLQYTTAAGWTAATFVGFAWDALA